MEKKTDKVKQIIEAATQEFLFKGFSSASMQNIAETAKVSKRTLYKYYPSKEMVYSTLIDELLDKMESAYSWNYVSNTPIKEQLTPIIIKKINLTLDESYLTISKIVISELLKEKKPNEIQLERMYRSEQAFLNWIILAQKDGQIREELSPQDIATQFHSILKGQIYWPILLGFKNKKDLDLEHIQEMALAFFINSFGK